MMSLPRVSAILSARNEEKYLPQVLTALRSQSHSLFEVSVVDDGSMDRTAQIAHNHGVIVTEMPYHRHRLFKEPGGLAKRFNKALDCLQPCDYILLIGSDDLLPSNYVEVLVKRLEVNPKLVMASGQMKGHPSDPLTPRGSGRLVKTGFWREISGMRFPIVSAWEEHMVYMALLKGYEARAFADVEYQSLRGDVGRHYLKMFGDGLAMYSLGYYWLYAFLRVVATFLSSPKEAYFLACGFWMGKRYGIRQTSFAKVLNRWQKWQVIHGHNVLLYRKFTTRIRHRGKKAKT